MLDFLHTLRGNFVPDAMLVIFDGRAAAFQDQAGFPRPLDRHRFIVRAVNDQVTEAGILSGAQRSRHLHRAARSARLARRYAAEARWASAVSRRLRC